MEEVPENGKELSHSALANGMSEWMKEYGQDSYEWGHSPVAGFRKHATEKWDMIKQGNFLAQLGY